MKAAGPDAICKIVKAHRNRSAAATLGYIWRADKCKAKFGSFDLGGITENIQVDADALSSGHQGRGEVVKHIVLSMRCAWSKKAENALFRMCHEWIGKFATGRNWIAGVHVKDDNVHCHIAVRNSGPNGRCLKYKKRDLYEMVQMAWTDMANPSKRTVAEKTLKLAKEKIEAGLGGRDTFESVREWAEMQVDAGLASVGRRDKAGRLTSIAIKGTRHRLKSLARSVKIIERTDLEEALPETEIIMMPPSSRSPENKTVAQSAEQTAISVAPPVPSEMMAFQKEFRRFQKRKTKVKTKVRPVKL